MKEKIVYISGPITNAPNGNRELFAEASRQVKSMGYFVRNPHDFCAYIPENSDWSIYMRRCVQQLMDCTDILMLPNYHTSKGALIELELARALGIKIHLSIESLNK